MDQNESAAVPCGGAADSSRSHGMIRTPNRWLAVVRITSGAAVTVRTCRGGLVLPRRETEGPLDAPIAAECTANRGALSDRDCNP